MPNALPVRHAPMKPGLSTRQILGIFRRNVGAVKVAAVHDGMLSTADHAAGLVDADGRALFPKAELVVHEDDLSFW